MQEPKGEQTHAKLTRANCPFSNVAMIIQWKWCETWGMGGGELSGKDTKRGEIGGRTSLKSFRANYKTLSRQAK